MTRRAVVRFDRSIVAAVLTSRIASCSVSMPIAGERAELDRPEHLGAIDVADPAHHPLVEEHLRDPGPHVGESEDQVDDLAEIGVRMAEIGAEAAHAGMPATVGLTVRLDEWER